MQHGSKKKNVPSSDILDSLKLAQNNSNGSMFNRAIQNEIQINNNSGAPAPAIGPPTTTTSYKVSQKRVNNRSSLQPKSRIQENDNVLIVSSRMVNKSNKKKNKLKIQDQTELESLNAQRGPIDKWQVNSTNGWKITSVSVKNNYKTLGQQPTLTNHKHSGSAVNANFSTGSSNKETKVNFSPTFQKKKQEKEKQTTKQTITSITSNPAQTISNTKK